MADTNLLTIFKALPEDVREWLASERVTYSIIDLNKRLNINEERVRIIPRLILRLVTQDLDARDFVSTLAIKLNISDSAAKIITKEIETKVLHQIEESLRVGAGVDIAMLHFGKEVGELESIKQESNKTRKQEEGTRQQPMPVGIEPHIESRGGGPKSEVRGLEGPEPKPKPTGPFILHTEKEPAKAIPQAPRPTFSIKIPITQKKYGAAPSVTARIETGELESIKQENNKARKQEEMREGDESKNQELGIKEKNAALLPPLRRLQMTDDRRPEAGEEKMPTKPPLRIPKIIMPKPQNEGSPSTSSGTNNSRSGAPQIKKVVHYSDFMTRLD